MEFCPQLSAFQGVIISADNVHPFSRLTSRGGNEEKIEYIVDSISRFLEDGTYRNQGVYAEDKLAKVRKFAFFLILNSDLSILSDMTDMDEIELVIWTIPTIPKCLMCEMFWRLNFDKFVYEAIAYTDPQLASELAFAFLENIKYYTPSECLKKISLISSALYKLFCRIYFFNFYSNTLADKLTMIFNNFQKALNFFTEPPKPERLNSLSKDDQYKYKGNCLNTMLLLVYKCLEEFITAQELSTISDPIYTLTYMGSVMENVTYRSCDCPSSEILEYLNKCNTALLDKFQELVMGVSVDIFCAWSEFEENGKSVQRNIGELCHKVHTKLLSVSSVADHPVLNMLQQITCKPENLNDVVKNLDPNSIIENINSSEDKATWLRALINKDDLYANEALVNCFSNHLNVLSEDESYSFYKNVNYYLKYGTNPVDNLNKLIVKLFQHCNVVAQQEILEEHFSNNCFENVMETDEFGNMMTETFNKLVVAPDADPTAILCLFLQNPEKVYMKIFDLAAENVQQSNIMIKAMKLLAKFTNHYYESDTEPCIIRVTQKAFENIDSEVKKFNTIYFICALKNCNSITATKLLLLIIMPHIHKYLLKKDIARLNVQCKLLHDAYTIEELLQYRAPMLAMVGQVLDTVRWKINTFIALAPETLQLTLRLQSSLFGTYNSGIPDNELNWLKNKLRNMQPLNMYYYRKLWNPPGSNFVEVTSRLNIQEGMDTEQVVTWLSQVICSCTQEEWCDIWESLTALGDLKVLDVIHNALSLITLAEQSNHTDNSWACILYCYRNLVYVIRYKFFKEPLRDCQVSAIIEKIAVTSNLVEEDSIEDLSTALLPLFAYLAEKRDQYNVDVTLHLTTKLRHSKFSDILSKVFSNGV